MAAFLIGYLDVPKWLIFFINKAKKCRNILTENKKWNKFITVFHNNVMNENGGYYGKAD
ncbi:MAG: hypothetical protein IJO97_05400 [Lachnospiraceae bacterium]|nr:hypothetical protein [Lachnospiraceae bacterium]